MPKINNSVVISIRDFLIVKCDSVSKVIIDKIKTKFIINPHFIVTMHFILFKSNNFD